MVEEDSYSKARFKEEQGQGVMELMNVINY